MQFVINNLSAQLIARALLEPGEQLTGKVMGKHQPWYTSFLKFDFLMPYMLFLATDRRLIVLEHRKVIFGGGYELTSIESAPWDVDELVAKGLFTKNKLRFSGRAERGQRRVIVNVPRFGAPLRKNGSELAAVVGAFQRRLLPAASGQATLPTYAPPFPNA